MTDTIIIIIAALICLSFIGLLWLDVRRWDERHEELYRAEEALRRRDG